MSTKCSQQVTTWLGMFKSWPQMIPKRNQPNNPANLTFHYKNPRKKNVHPKTHIYTCPNHALRLGLQWPNKNEQKKTWKTTQTQHQATTEPEISRMLRCLPPAPALPPWSTESHDCVQGWLCYRCCCIYLTRQPFWMGFCADVPMTTSPYIVETI